MMPEDRFMSLLGCIFLFLSPVSRIFGVEVWDAFSLAQAGILFLMYGEIIQIKRKDK